MLGQHQFASFKIQTLNDSDMLPQSLSTVWNGLIMCYASSFANTIYVLHSTGFHE